MNKIFTIIKKEFRRTFTDPRMLISLILPGILIYILYSLMGGFMFNDESNTDYQYNVIVVNHQEDLDLFFENDQFLFTYLDEEDDSYKQKLEDKEIDLYVIYPLNFYEDALNFEPGDEKTSPEVKVFYNSTKSESYDAYSNYLFILSSFQEQISEKFRINKSNEVFDLASSSSLTIEILSTMLPFLLVIFLFSGVMQVSIESIAGEKERGTIATILTTPIKRSELAIGKIVSLSIIALVSAFSSFIGLILSIPKLMGSVDLELQIYGFSEYTLLFLVLASTTLLYVSLISLVSAYSKSVKEAQSFAVIIMVLNMIIGITSMSGNVSQSSNYYFIPLYNSVLSITSILKLSLNPINFIITILSNLVIVLLGVFILSKMFSSEKIMFKK
ncbi:MAG: ABC transporter permease [Acholeplasmataceae bacterium]